MSLLALSVWNSVALCFLHCTLLESSCCLQCPYWLCQSALLLHWGWLNHLGFCEAFTAVMQVNHIFAYWLQRPQTWRYFSVYSIYLFCLWNWNQSLQATNWFKTWVTPIPDWSILHLWHCSLLLFYIIKGNLFGVFSFSGAHHINRGSVFCFYQCYFQSLLLSNL